MKRLDKIHSILSQALKPISIKITDDSDLHVGHAGAKSGGHFKLFIVSECFDNMNLLDRHKLVYAKLNDLMKTEIHFAPLIQVRET